MNEKEPLLPEETPEIKTNRKRATLCMGITSVLLFGVFAVSKGVYESGVQVLDLAFIRALVSFIHAFGVLKCNNLSFFPDDLRKNRKTQKYLFYRSFTQCVDGIMIYYAISLLAMGPLVTIDNTSPFMALIFGYFRLGESISILEFICMIFAFTGIVLVAFAQKSTPELEPLDEEPIIEN